MGELDFEQRNRLETEVLPAVIGAPEYAAATIVRLEARVAVLEEALLRCLLEAEMECGNDDAIAEFARAALAGKEE